ncbi:MAG: PQQ-binding-like beta-propeller repeat protein [Bacteroidales bacterium]|jgi:outer membrane protein assembly factor BamB|nr:PQQ-binding-like beta-propeller repeat protein [Bacteroidales bacterium]
MIRRILQLFLILNLIFPLGSQGQEILQWGGPERSGVFRETNLMKSWPESGPSLLWEYDNIGNGYGSPVITKKNIFVNGEIDTVSYLFALDLQGKFLWKAKIGKEWILNYPGSRSTPTVVDDLVYATTGMGQVGCLDTQTGKERWSVNMMTDFHGPVPRFGFSESVLVDGNTVYCSPGSPDTNVVALDRFTGKIIWICKGTSEMTAYCSPMLISLSQRNILVTFSKTTLLGIDTKDGKLLWSYKQEGQDIDCQVNTPIFENGFIYFVAGNGNGAVKLKLSDDGTQITEVWKNGRCDNLMGGFIKVNDHIYTSGYEKRQYYVVETNTGAIVDSVKFDRGTINYADGMLYLYNEKGQVGLFRPNGPKMEQVSSFRLTRGTKAHFSHPVICNGILYIRHGRSVMAYGVKKGLKE